MKFSLFFEMQMGDATPEKEQQLFRDSVEQARLADQIGYHAVWEVGHHGLYEYSHCSAPEVFLSFVAAQTSRIRLGHGCTLLPYRYNHPIRIAERIATLDILSGGRVNWGTARSGARVEQEAFDCNKSTSYDEWREALEMIPKMWNSESFSYQGRFFKILPTHIVPTPVQKPHPPIFAACTKPDDAHYLGQLRNWRGELSDKTRRHAGELRTRLPRCASGQGRNRVRRNESLCVQRGGAGFA